MEEHSMNVYEKRNAMLGVAFDRYVLDHPSFAARIPRGAQIILQIPGDTKFNAWARRLADRQREAGQPVVQVVVERLQAPKSRLVSPRLQIETA
ncbi:MAG: DUF5647 family protein [candidate division NC10 bacterium]